MSWKRLLGAMLPLLVACALVGCGNSKKTEEGRAQLMQRVADQLQAAQAKADAYDFDGASAILRDLPEEVNKSPFADVATYDKLTADVEAIRRTVSQQEAECSKKIRAGWKLIDGRLVSPAEQQRALAQEKRQQEKERRKREEEARLAKVRRKAEEERRKAAIAAITAWAPPPARKGTLRYEVDQACKELRIPPDDVRITISEKDDEVFAGHKKGYIHVWILLGGFDEHMCRGWTDHEKERVMDVAASAALKWLRANALDDPPVAGGLTVFFAEHWKRYPLTKGAPQKREHGQGAREAPP